MSTTSEAVVNLTLRNIDAGDATEITRADPTPDEPARRAAYISRMYRLTFAAERPGMFATFVVDIGWEGRHGETECAAEDLEAVGRTLIKGFASGVALAEPS